MWHQAQTLREGRFAVLYLDLIDILSAWSRRRTQFGMCEIYFSSVRRTAPPEVVGHFFNLMNPLFNSYRQEYPPRLIPKRSKDVNQYKRISR